MEIKNGIKNAILLQSDIYETKFDPKDKNFPEKIKLILEEILFNISYYQFKLISSYQYSYSSSGNVKINFFYHQTKSESDELDNYIGKLLKSLLKTSMTELEKLIVIHDFIIQSIEYDYTYTVRSPYHAMNKKKSVCYGFALLGGRILEKAGIKQVYVEGDSSQPGSSQKEKHIWNKVEISRHWYNIDFTWDSCVKKVNPYKYFCTTDSQLSKTHFPSLKLINIPKSSSSPFYKLLNVSKLSLLEKKIYSYVSPGRVIQTPTELSQLLGKEGEYVFSLAMGVNPQKIIDSALKSKMSLFSGYEFSFYNNEVLGVQSITLKLKS